jgi:hypothetical protein
MDSISFRSKEHGEAKWKILGFMDPSTKVKLLKYIVATWDMPHGSWINASTKFGWHWRQ